MQTLIKCHIMWHFIRIFTYLPKYLFAGIQNEKGQSKLLTDNGQPLQKAPWTPWRQVSHKWLKVSESLTGIDQKVCNAKLVLSWVYEELELSENLTITPLQCFLCSKKAKF